MTLIIEVKTTTIKNETEIKVNHKAELDSDTLSFQAVASFQKNINKLNKMLKSAIKTGAFVELDIIKYKYDSSKQVISNFDRWYYVGYPQFDSCELDNGILGYYLQPDTKYTEQHRDMVYDYSIESISD